MKSRIVIAIALVTPILLLTGCPDDVVTPDPNGTINGVIYDSVSGDPVSGVTVAFAGTSATTDANGTYSIDLGASSGDVTGPLEIHKDNYVFLYNTEMVADASQDYSVAQTIEPIDDSAYTTKTVTLTVEADDSGGTVDYTGWSADVAVLKNGAVYDGSIDSSAAGAFTGTIDTTVFGSDVLVAIEVFDDASAVQFATIREGVDLSGTAPSLTFAHDDSDVGSIVTVTVEGQTDNMFSYALVTDYGLLEDASGGMFSDPTTSGTVEIPVPAQTDIQGVWLQIVADDSYGSDPGPSKLLFAYSSLVSAQYTAGDTVTLPTPATGMGPTSAPDPVEFGYTTGTLSVTEFQGIAIHQFAVYEDTSAPPNRTKIGDIQGVLTNQIALPDWVKNKLTGATRTVELMPLDVSVSNELSLVTAEFLDFPAGTTASIAFPGNPFSGAYADDLTF
jgi:hypothetical protein